MTTARALPEVLAHSPVRVLFGSGTVARLGRAAREIGASSALVVTDPGIEAAGHALTALDSIRGARVQVEVFNGTRENPTTEHVAAGLAVARSRYIDMIIAVGGGSAMDCAKGINLLLTNGGAMADYVGEGRPAKPLLPMIAVPTTAGTGSEAQSFALISDPVTHRKMACGDRRLPAEGGLRPRVAILDPELTRSQPAKVAAASGIDAIAHAVETAATTRRNEVSRAMSREAWNLLSSSFAEAVRNPDNGAARADMLLGAHVAGAAIEASMLGAAHACSNPLTARFNVTHGFAVGMMLPHVIRFNCDGGANPYADLCDDGARLAERIAGLMDVAGGPRTLGECGVEAGAIPELAADAAGQWTAQFNPRPVGVDQMCGLYEAAMG